MIDPARINAGGAPQQDFDLCLCMFGSPARGPLRLRVYGSDGDLTFGPLSRVCHRTPAGWACGNKLHAQSGLVDGVGPSSPSQAFPAQFVRRLAGMLAQWALTATSRRRLALTGPGRVHRHVDRGETVE